VHWANRAAKMKKVRKLTVQRFQHRASKVDCAKKKDNTLYLYKIQKQLGPAFKSRTNEITITIISTELLMHLGTSTILFY